jgi:hypothetical protein
VPPLGSAAALWDEAARRRGLLLNDVHLGLLTPPSVPSPPVPSGVYMRSTLPFSTWAPGEHGEGMGMQVQVLAEMEVTRGACCIPQAEGCRAGPLVVSPSALSTLLPAAPLRRLASA